MINGINKNSYDISNMINKNQDLNLDEDNSNKNILNQDTKIINEEFKDVVNRIKSEVEKAISIGLKIIKDENISKSEEKFINIKYPDIKMISEKLKKDINQFKNELINCDSDEERTNLINKEINNIKIMGKKGLVSEVEVKLKLESLKEVKKFSNFIKMENKKAENIAIKLLKNQKITSKELEFIKEKIPNIKQIIKANDEAIKILKEKIKNCNSDSEITKLVNDEIKDTKNSSNKGLISEVKVKLKLESLKEVKKFSEFIKLENRKVEVIATKLFKNEKITPKELEFIKEKIPNIKQIVNDIKNENQLLKHDIICCETELERKENITKNIVFLERLLNSGELSNTELKLYLIYMNSLGKNTDKEKSKMIWMNPYIYLNFIQLENVTKFILVIFIVLIILKFI